MVNCGQLIDEQNLPPPRCDDLGDCDPAVVAFYESTRR